MRKSAIVVSKKVFPEGSYVIVESPHVRACVKLELKNLRHCLLIALYGEIWDTPGA